MPELPPTPQPPVQHRVTVETLRRDRGVHDARLHELRAERDVLAAHDPVQLRAELEAAEHARAEAEESVGRVEEAATAAEAAREAAAEVERDAAEGEAAVNKAWRDASTELDRLRERYEEEDRTRGDIERRIREAERLIREGHRPTPRSSSVRSARTTRWRRLEKRSELVQRRARPPRSGQPPRHRGVRGAPGAARLHGPRARRRAQGPPRPPRGRREGGPGDHRDLHHRLPRRRDAVRAADRGTLPRRRGTAGADRPRRAAHERHRDRGLAGAQAREADQPALGRRTLAHRDGVPVRDLHGAALALLPDGRGRARPRRREPAPVPAAGGGIRGATRRS